MARFALLKRYRARARVITEPERNQAHQRLLKLRYIQEEPLNLLDLHVSITTDGQSALLDHAAMKRPSLLLGWG
jgi:hypothetical protein